MTRRKLFVYVVIALLVDATTQLSLGVRAKESRASSKKTNFKPSLLTGLPFWHSPGRVKNSHGKEGSHSLGSKPAVFSKLHGEKGNDNVMYKVKEFQPKANSGEGGGRKRSNTDVEKSIKGTDLKYFAEGENNQIKKRTFKLDNEREKEAGLSMNKNRQGSDLLTFRENFGRGRKHPLEDNDRGREDPLENIERDRGIPLEDNGRGREDPLEDNDIRGREDSLEDNDRGREDPLEDNDRGREDPLEDNDIRGREDSLEDNDRGREDPLEDSDRGIEDPLLSDSDKEYHEVDASPKRKSHNGPKRKSHNGADSKLLVSNDGSVNDGVDTEIVENQLSPNDVPTGAAASEDEEDGSLEPNDKDESWHSHISKDPVALKTVADKALGAGLGPEVDWKFHFKEREPHEDQEGDEGDYSFHMEKRDAPVGGEGAGTQADWKSHVGEMLEKAAALPVNNTVDSGNHTAVNRSQMAEDAVPVAHAPTTEKAEEEKQPELPPKGAAEEEHHSSLTIFFILLVVAISILVVHLLIQTKFHYLPDSIAIVLIGAFIGLLLKLFKFGNWKNEEAFPPTVFFIVLLPPIIFEGGYNLHKGNFFHNIGSIMVFAVVGTAISAMIVGGGIYLLGQAEVVYQFDLVESFAFGSLISAVDPVATLAIFQALDVDPILYMLVFGESMLNDAVSIVLTTTLLEFASPATVVTSGAAAFFQAVARFSLMFFGSAAIGVLFGLLSAVVTKFFDFHKTPSLEVGMVFAFSYLPYALAEGIHLSGIMAILFCGIVMSHYTHLNLSPISQITVQQTFRTIAFIAETCVFAYLGLAIFSFKVNVKPAFTIWSIILILVGRAANIFPLSFLMNFFREHKITQKNQFIMWFSGLRGAVAFALSLHMGLENQEKQYVLVTTTLILVLFTIVFLGGSTMPLLKFLQTSDEKYKKKKKHDSEVSMSKTKEMGDAIDSEHLSELTEEDETHVIRHHVKGFLKLDARYLIPFFTKRFTQQEMREGRSQVDLLAKQWQMEVRAAPSETDGEEDSTAEMIAETSLMGNGNSAGASSNNGRRSWD